MPHRMLLATITGAVIFSSTIAGVKAHEYTIVDDTIPVSLTGVPGDPVKGKKLAINRKKGNCLACHAMPIPEEQFHGEVGPDLHGVGSRMTEAELRLRLVNSKALNPDTIMPAFHKVALNRVLKKFKGKTILGAQEVEDIIAYLMTIKS
ncbi:MAG: sulfur oxidation c-type cytochrome SoxX [Magnetovibrio sp.]|nr:sulfur oxidation c-type cytochrome SoxX [Magnetovibrio sp.]|tara:strand:- start:954 stop:1400 length:447 start_codon:yes stop_codon:yes gene_type:complete